jgi:hypothetical protein
MGNRGGVDVRTQQIGFVQLLAIRGPAVRTIIPEPEIVKPRNRARDINRKVSVILFDTVKLYLVIYPVFPIWSKKQSGNSA